MSLINNAIQIKNDVLNFFFPTKCLYCGEEKVILCDACLEKINRPSIPRDKDIHTSADYCDPIVQRAIWHLKYHGVKTAADPLARLMASRLKNVLNPYPAIPPEKKEEWFLVPIPLSPKRYRQRGFNQAALIAKSLSDRLDTESPNMSFMVLNNVLYKIRETKTQVSIRERKERLKNLVESFGVKNANLIKNKKIILIDDVCTTGATIREAAKTLRSAGTKKVIAFVAARG